MSTTASDSAIGPPLPEQVREVNKPALSKFDEPEIVEAVPEEHPTDSHELANADHEEKGAAQMDHGQTEVRDLGWSEDPKDVPSPLVGGLPNEQLWTLIRRFNKVSKKMSGILDWAELSTANVPCQVFAGITSWRPGPQHCR